MTGPAGPVEADWGLEPVWAAPPLPEHAAPSDDASSPTRVRRRRRRRRRIALAVVVLVVAVVVVELVGRSIAAREIDARLREGGITGEIEVTVGSSPWRPTVLPALVTGNVDEVAISVRDGALAGVPVEQLEYRLEGIDGDVSLLHGTVAVHSIDIGSVSMRIPPDVVAQGVGVPLEIRDGEVYGGDPPQPVTIDVAEGTLVLTGGPFDALGRPGSVELVDPYVMPCRPHVTVLDDTFELACTGDRLPGILQVPLEGSQEPPATIDPADLPAPQSTVRDGG